MNRKHIKTVIRNGKIYTYHRRKVTLRDGTPKEITAKSKAELEKKHTQVLKDFDQSMGPESRNMTVADVAGEYLADFIDVDAPKTRESRIHHLNKYILPEFGHRKAKNVTGDQIRSFFSKVRSNNGHKKVNEVYKHLRQLVEWAVDNQRGFSSNPITKDVIKRIRRTAKAERRFDGHERVEKSYSLNDANRILDAVSEIPAEIVVQLQLLHGLRIGEALAMHWSDVDLVAGEIHVRRQVSSTSKSTRVGTRYETDTNLIETHPKTEQSNRYVPLHDKTRELLLRTAVSKRTGLIFATSKGTPMSQSNYRKRIFNPLMKALGLILRPHDLRKMFGSFIVASGVDIATAARWMGHSKPSTLLDHYTKVVDERANSVGLDIGR